MSFPLLTPPPTHCLDLTGGNAASELVNLTPGMGVLALEVDGRITHLGAAPNLQRRAGRTMKKVAGAVAGNGQRMLAILCWEVRSKLESSLLLYRLAKQCFPRDYLQRVHLRMPWFVGLLNEDRFPRVVMGNRLSLRSQPVVGPFAQREAAQLYAEALQSAFLLRRCVEVLDPRPDHPGCIYGEMAQCLRPCQCAVSDDLYLAEARSVAEALRKDVSLSLRQTANERETAGAALDFEAAARHHKRFEKLKALASARPSVVQEAGTFGGVAIVPEEKLGDRGESRAQIFPLIHGQWQEPLSFSRDRIETAMREIDEIFRQPSSSHSSDAVPLENLALFSRWYYSSWREGDWIPMSTGGKPPLRRILHSLRKHTDGSPVAG